MDFVAIPGLKGKVYIPSENANLIKKHHCRDCYFCQWCADDKCCICSGQKENSDKKCCSKTAEKE
jgi:hypothetical protein